MTPQKFIKAAVIHIDQYSNSSNPSAELNEAINLAQAINLNICHTDIIKIRVINPGTLFGLGNINKLAEIILAKKITLIIINHSLSPIHQRNLELQLKAKVIDRTGLILEIFGKRARTSEGKLQVELAALQHQRTRLVRSWTHLERQRGGFGFTGGPGEKQIELDRRLIDNRIMRLQRDLEKVSKTRQLHRARRKKNKLPIIALVGYTNAGKSTLFNLLTKANTLEKDMLFTTLDPIMRPVILPNNQKIILSDTVGFIADLPTALIAAFKATLEEVIEADIILHVRDITHPEKNLQKDIVEKILQELGIDITEQNRYVSVINKIDSFNKSFDIQSFKAKNCVYISALKNLGINELQNTIIQNLNPQYVHTTLFIPYKRSDLLAWCYRQGEIISRQDQDEKIVLDIRLHPDDNIKIHDTLLHST